MFFIFIRVEPGNGTCNDSMPRRRKSAHADTHNVVTKKKKNFGHGAFIGKLD